MKPLSACTSVMVGKDASIDGSTMIARNDDTFLPLTPQRFVVHPAYQDETRQWISNQNGFRLTLPRTGMRYSATPNADDANEGVYAESGFNEVDVAMSATESVYGNPATLAYDPWVPAGLAEDSLPSVVLPYIHSSREGVEYLGQLIKQYGSPEGNGVMFSDHDEIWYMEIVTGHHWVAARIPDDAYVVVANQVAIQTVDFSDPQNFMWSAGLQEFVEQHHLNPNRTGFNFRKIFGTSNEKDRNYNTPRVWYGQRYLTPSLIQSPTSADMPFVLRADRKIGVEDVQFILSSHYNETEFDPLAHGQGATKTKYRPIAMNRTQNSHVLQLKNDGVSTSSAIMWLNFGIPTFSPYVPFFGNVQNTAPSYAETPLEMDDISAYWMYRKLSMLVESHYADFIQLDRDFKTAMMQMFIEHVAKTRAHADQLPSKQVSAYLEQQNQRLVDIMEQRVHSFMNQLMSKGLTLSKLTYNMDKNL
ncbi:dipeptidase [Fructilactobacillus florum 8D]|uniref:Dipeptidase n=1 Tax=Fructilactobacillus florum 8D TaxID=1221538 RepID=W9EDC3_9LACO|nr:C69 family dipeptidase [Fructilactobacillus florum]EKK20088.1 dipeptidase [Fructilactobacillus florum 2F]ETO40072.1 dipeptidase [Fructilactobacillus florum 8D]